MKLTPGPHPISVTTGGVTKVNALVGPGGDTLNMGTETYTYIQPDGPYVGDHVDATFDPHADGTFQGATGTPPNVRVYGGTWQ